MWKNFIAKTTVPSFDERSIIWNVSSYRSTSMNGKSQIRGSRMFKTMSSKLSVNLAFFPLFYFFFGMKRSNPNGGCGSGIAQEKKNLPKHYMIQSGWITAQRTVLLSDVLCMMASMAFSAWNSKLCKPNGVYKRTGKRTRQTRGQKYSVFAGPKAKCC